MSFPARIATSAVVSALGMAGLWANDRLGLGHHASSFRILVLLASGPLLGAVLAKLVIREARTCSTLVLAAAGLAGLIGSLMLGPRFQELYGSSPAARWLERAPPAPPYVYPSRGLVGFVFAASCLASLAATCYRPRTAEGGAARWAR